ncbi:MAG: hypothetical protein KBF42_01205 [Chitinophagales bacterium]|jgi:hypothetical protein|nr:hypothetical protein [Bacteroidota bacterium]MBK7569844.1 hypothetical protein [Bacteroidota bacterium]MBP8915574.1 hypothetical protein [Chitinophagales bacterium]MBP9219974.1 hypothetical protein [Chitinophagales bacterium]MBP9794549.1 hypothetical protein [Chitinophagales bacterium]
MNKVILYKNQIPLRPLFVFEIFIGAILITFFIYLFLSEIYPDIWTFAGPLLGLAIFVTGLTGSKIKEINLESSSRNIEIIRESLFKTRINYIDPFKMTVELKTANGKKNSMIPKLKLIILESEKEIEKLESGFLSMNNHKIKKLHNELKSVIKITNAKM